MKWATLICLVLCSIVTESRHLQKRDAGHENADHHSRLIGGIYATVGKTNFNHLLLAMLAENYQKCTVEEHEKAMEDISAFAKHCVDHEEDEECKKPMITIFYDKTCKYPEVAERYEWSKECCAKADPEREKCFHDHSDYKEEEFKKPDAESACKQHKEDHDHALHYYIVNIAKKHPDLFPPAVLTLAAKYDAVITHCCEAEDKDKCFDDKFPDLIKATHYIEQKQKHTCHILAHFHERVYQALKIAQISQKFPGASFEIVHKLSAEALHLSKDCCKADVVECMIERLDYTQHICDNHEKISPNLKACCEKPLLERTPCMIALPKDDIPEDLPKELPKEYIEDEKLCDHFKDHKDVHLAKFLHDFAKRHPELSLQALLRVGKGYEGVLTKCCASEHPVECCKTAHQLLADGIKESQDLVKQNCDAYEHLGPYGYNIYLLGLYTKRMPQVSDGTLLHVTGKMTKIGGKCCALPENQRLPCAEEKLDLLLGEMCEKQSATFINDQVRHCCDDSYADRRKCFTGLGLDPSYNTPAFDESTFNVGAEICEGTEQEQQAKRLTLFVHVLKLNPDMPKEKMKGTVEEFKTVREKCCAADVPDRQSCFDKERPTLLLHLKEVIAH